MAPRSRRHRPRELPYNFKHRLTFSITPPPHHPNALLVDVYPFQPSFSPLDGTASDRASLSWVLYIPSPVQSSAVVDTFTSVSSTGGRGRGAAAAAAAAAAAGKSNDARRKIPHWLYRFCRRNGLPLVSIDHDYLVSSLPSLLSHDIAITTPSASPSSPTGGDSPRNPTTTLQSTLDELLVEDQLNWSLLSSGPGAGADTGTEGLDRNYDLFRSKGGLNLARTIVVAAGESAEETMRYFHDGRSAVGSSEGGEAGQGQGQEHAAVTPVALALIDPQPGIASSIRQQQLDFAGGTSSSNLFPPTLLLSLTPPMPTDPFSTPAPPTYSQTLLDIIRHTSPEATALDDLLSGLEHGGHSSHDNNYNKADVTSTPTRKTTHNNKRMLPPFWTVATEFPQGSLANAIVQEATRRFHLHFLASAQDLQSLRANSNEFNAALAKFSLIPAERSRSGSKSSSKSGSSSSSSKSAAAAAAAAMSSLPSTLALLESFMLHWLGTAIEGGQPARPDQKQINSWNTNIGKRIMTLSKSRL